MSNRLSGIITHLFSGACGGLVVFSLCVSQSATSKTALAAASPAPVLPIIKAKAFQLIDAKGRVAASLDFKENSDAPQLQLTHGKSYASLSAKDADGKGSADLMLSNGKVDLTALAKEERAQVSLSKSAQASDGPFAAFGLSANTPTMFLAGAEPRLKISDVNEDASVVLGSSTRTMPDGRTVSSPIGSIIVTDDKKNVIWQMPKE